VKLTTHLHLVPSAQYAFMAWCAVKAQGQLYLYRYLNNESAIILKFLVGFGSTNCRCWCPETIVYNLTTRKAHHNTCFNNIFFLLTTIFKHVIPWKLKWTRINVISVFFQSCYTNSAINYVNIFSCWIISSLQNCKCRQFDCFHA